MKQNYKGPKILVLDIETTPLEVYTWGIFDQNIAPQQIIKDWSVLAWAACWMHDPTNIMYADTRKQKNKRDDKKILKKIHQLMDEADIVLGQNSNSFDIKKLNTRFIAHKMKPPSNYRKIDTKRIAKKHFAFTTASLDFMTKTLNSRQEKMKSSGLDMWIQCLKGNMSSFKELEKYNKQDVAATVALYELLKPWDTSVNMSVYTDDFANKCNCGGSDFIKKGYNFSTVGKFQRWQCKECGACFSSKENLLPKEKRKALMKGL